MNESLVGRTISHYKILRKLGQGGMGVVYQAEDTKLRRTVALKFLPMQHLWEEDLKERFVREAQAAASLDHPNICTIHGIDEAEGFTFIVMAYVDGPDLRHLVKKGPLDLDQALEVTIQAARGIQQAHEKGVVHRDIKSANIMLNQSGVTKVMDFGLARSVGSSTLTKSGTTPGTPAYMSPEQLTGKELDSRTDIWSLGVVLYEMLTGEQAFRGEYEQALYYAIVNEEPAPVTSLRAGIPLELGQVVSKALAKNRDERYQHVDELVADLRSIQRVQESGSSSKPSVPFAGTSGGRGVASGQTAVTIPTGGLAPQKRRAWIGLAALVVVILASFGFWLWTGAAPATEAPAISEVQPPSLAVLPFRTMSADEEDEYFSAGLTEDLINLLARVPHLRVVARTSAFAFQGETHDVREIGSTLNVSHLLEGSVRRAGDQLRITAQLVSVEDGFHIWSNTYDREMKDVFAIQGDIAQSIVKALEIRLTSELRDQESVAYTGNMAAVQHHWKGRVHWRKLSPEGFQQGLDEFEQAVKENPQYAPAHAWIANSYLLLATTGQLAPREALEKAKPAAERAVQLDANLPEGHTALGGVKSHLERDWKGADQEFRRAIQLRPGDSHAHMLYASMCLIQTGRFREARNHLEEAQELDPLSIEAHLNAAWLLVAEGDYDQGITELQEIQALHPHSYFGPWGIGLAWLGKEKYRKAIKSFEQARELSDDSPHVVGMLGATYALAGDVQQARQLLHRLEVQSKRKYVSPIDFAWIHIALGDHLEALDWLEKAYDDYSPYMGFLNVFTVHKPLRGHPRFIALQKKMGLTDSNSAY